MKLLANLILFAARLFRLDEKEIPIQERSFGWKKDKKDKRDLKFMGAASPRELIPVDLRKNCPMVLDQKTLASCTAFGVTQLVSAVRKKQGFKALNRFWPTKPEFSALFTYYVTRKLEGTVSQDSGATVRNALKSVVKFGVAQEKFWPYKIEKYNVSPSEFCFDAASDYQALVYKRIKDGAIDEMKQCLASGYPFVFGMMMYDSFGGDLVKKSGIVPMPDVTKEKLLGGHCMMCVGWKNIDNTPYFIVQNSWGLRWGDKGFCYIPFEFMKNPKLACDFWTITTVEK